MLRIYRVGNQLPRRSAALAASAAVGKLLKLRACELGCVLFVVALATPIHATIIWEGREVAEWPDQFLTALGKSSAGSAPAPSGYYPSPKGIVYGLTMIVDFSDSPAIFTRVQVDDWLNKPGYVMGSAKGSVRDYYLEVSNGQVDLRNDVAGYYRAKKTKAYYEETSASELVNELIEYFDAQGMDFSKYDNDKNGTTESISFVYAGRPEGRDAGKLWPHSSTVGLSKDGVKLGRYNMSDMSDNLALYVFAHETGHMVFGWPDLYWFGDWCMMGNRMSDANPQAINDFYRADQGWIPTVTVTAGMSVGFNAPVRNQGYRYVNPAKPEEMYFWSNVVNTGRWSNIRGRGIVLYHFDRSRGGNSSAGSRGLAVVEADGDNKMTSAQWPVPGSAASDLFHAGTHAEVSDHTIPSLKWYDGSNSGLRIHDIGAPADTMFFAVGTGAAAIPIAERFGKPGRPVYFFDLLGRWTRRLLPKASHPATVTSVSSGSERSAPSD
ncbi:MAG: M6 family metalloprotease domain-containing protein [Fibrobacteria bacterium]